MYFYQRIRDLREDNDLSQQKVADYLEVTRQQYQLYECGKREMPMHLFIKLADCCTGKILTADLAVLYGFMKIS